MKVKVLEIKHYKRWPSFNGNTFKPLNNVIGVLPLVNTCCWENYFVNFIYDWLILPISHFDGLISLNDNVWGNPSLWSLTVMKASVSCICYNLSRNSHRRCSVRKGVPRNFGKFLGKYLYQSLFFNKVAGLSLATLLKRKLWHRCFPVNFAKFLRIPFLQNTSSDCFFLFWSISAYGCF